MKKFLTVVLLFIFSFSCISFLPACANSEISIKYMDSKLYARFDSGVPGSGLDYQTSHMEYNSAISFAEYEKGSENCISRSNYYVRFYLIFNSTPKGYKAIDIYKLNYLTLDSFLDKDKKLFSKKEGKTDKEIEILIYLQNYTVSETEHTVKSLTYTTFDSTVGENVQKTFDLNYKFNIQPIPNFFNRFNADSKFDVISVECSKSKFKFTVESNIDYDKILYKVDKNGRYKYSSHYSSLVTEDTMNKSEIYTYESDIYEYYWYVNFTVVGYQNDNINYYTYPMGFGMLEN